VPLKLDSVEDGREIHLGILKDDWKHFRENVQGQSLLYHEAQKVIDPFVIKGDDGIELSLHVFQPVPE